MGRKFREAIARLSRGYSLLGAFIGTGEAAFRFRC